MKKAEFHWVRIKDLGKGWYVWLLCERSYCPHPPPPGYQMMPGSYPDGNFPVYGGY